MRYALFQLGLLTLPGALVVWGARLGSHRFLYTIAISYSYYALFAAAGIALHWTTGVVAGAYALGLMVLLAVMGYFRYQSGDQSTHTDHASQRWVLFGAAGVALGYALYRLWAAAYFEVPGDVYRHLEYARNQLEWVQQGFLNADKSWAAIITQRGGIWYSLLAWGSDLTGISLLKVAGIAMWINGSLFLLGVYFLALAVIENRIARPAHRVLIAMLASLLTAVHFGINVFAYLRYYSLAPTMLNMVIFFAGVVTVLQLLRGAGKGLRCFLLLCYLLFVMAMATVHTQEALFLLTITFLMLGVAVGQRAIRAAGERPTLMQFIAPWPARVFWLMTLAALVSMLWVYFNEPRPTDWFGKITQLSEGGTIASRILYLTPDFQFIRVVTLWGLLVYLGFFWKIRQFASSPYLLAGMISPLFTVFNPLFVDFFLRLDGPHTLWRMLYLVPFHVVAALLFYHAVRALMSGTRVSRLLNAGLLAGLIALLLPIEAGGWKNSYSRLTLAPVAEENSYHHWQDLLDFLNAAANAAPKNILTDPVTGYVISGATPHRTFRYKFQPLGAYKKYRFDFPDYSDQPLKRYTGWWLIVNDREGGHSQVGEMAKHWPADIMKTSKYYGEALRAHLKANPGRFRLLWSQGRISVYEISG